MQDVNKCKIKTYKHVAYNYGCYIMDRCTLLLYSAPGNHIATYEWAKLQNSNTAKKDTFSFGLQLFLFFSRI